MSSESIITVENLSKSYTLKHQQDAHYSTLRDTLVNGVKGFGKKILGRSNPDFQEKEEFWALKDVNFEIKQGDRVGIIGRNDCDR
jgi:lipopolysaccharide transport system ATP-binding protein